MIRMLMRQCGRVFWISAAGLLVVLAAPSITQAQCGNTVGPAQFSSAASSRLNLAAENIGGTDQIYLSYVDNASVDINVRRFNATSGNWELVGSSGFVDVDADRLNVPILKLTDTGSPVISASDAADGGRANMYIYDPADGWLPLSPSGGAGDGPTIDPAFDLIPGFGPLLAFGERGVGARVFYFDAADNVFLELTTGILLPGETKDFSVEFDAQSGRVYISFLERRGPEDWVVRVIVFNGTTIGDLGNPQALFSSRAVSANDLKLTSGNGQPIITFSDASVSDRITVAQYDGTEWQIVGTRGVSDNVSSDADISFRDGRLYIGYIDQIPGMPTAQVRYFDGTDWVEACPGASSLGIGFWGTLAATESNVYMGFVNLSSQRTTVVSVPIEVNVQALIETPNGTEIGCGSETLLLDASASSGAPNLQYLWSTGETSPSIIVQNAGTYSVTVTDPSSGASDMGSITITVGATPTASISATTTDLTTAQPTATLTAQFSGQPPTALIEYVWSTGETTRSITVTAAGTYTVTINFIEPDDMFVLCSAQASITITDSRGGGGNVQAIITTPLGTTLTCDNNLLLLDASNSTGAANLTYLWSTGQITSSIDVSTPGTYSVTVTDPASQASSTASVQIDQSLPVVSISASTTDLTLAQPTATLTAQASGQPANALLEYVWSTGATTQAITVTAAGTYTVTINFLEPDDMFVLCSGQASITITDSRGSGGNPNCAKIVATAQEITCLTPNVTLDASSSLGGNPGPATYLWSTGSTNPFITVSAAGTYAVIVNAPTIGCLDTATIIITKTGNLPQPLIVAPEGTSLACGTASVVLDGSDSSGDGPLTFLWSTGNTEPIITVFAAGNYTLTVTNADRCSASTSITISGMNAGLLEASFLVGAEVCAGDSLHMIDYSLLEDMADVDFRWDFGDGNFSTERDPVHAYVSPGNYLVKFEASSNGCPPERIVKPVQVSQCLLRTFSSGLAAQVTPTLTRGPVQLQVELVEPGEVIVDIINGHGQVLSTLHLAASDRFTEQISLPGTGHYFLRLRHLHGSKTLRVVVME